jgi:hypothetical protein
MPHGNDSSPHDTASSMASQLREMEHTREWRRGQGLVRWAEEPRAARLRKGTSDVKQIEHFRLAQRVNERGASTSGAGVRSDVSGIGRDG